MAKKVLILVNLLISLSAPHTGLGVGSCSGFQYSKPFLFTCLRLGGGHIALVLR